MSDFVNWLLGLVKSLFLALWDLIADVFIAVFGWLLDIVAYIINHIPVPDFLSAYSIQILFQPIHPTILYFAQFFNFPMCFGLISAGVAFRLTRKFLTLFQW